MQLHVLVFITLNFDLNMISSIHHSTYKLKNMTKSVNVTEKYQLCILVKTQYDCDGKLVVDRWKYPKTALLHVSRKGNK